MTGPRITPGSRTDVGLVAWLVSQGAGIAGGTTAPNLFLTLAKHRRLFFGWLRFAGRLMPGGRLPRRDTELVILRVAHLRQCRYEFDHHVRLGRRAGVTAADVERLIARPIAAVSPDQATNDPIEGHLRGVRGSCPPITPSTAESRDTSADAPAAAPAPRTPAAAPASGAPNGWSPRHDAMLEVVDQLVERRDVGDEAWAAARAVLDERELIELVLLATHYDLLATTIGTLRIQPDRRRFARPA